MKLILNELYRLVHDRTVLIASAIFAAVIGPLYATRGFHGTPAMLLANPMAPIWAGVILAPLMISSGYENRTTGLVLSSGQRPIAVAVVRTLVCCVFTAISAGVTQIISAVISVGVGSFDGEFFLALLRSMLIAMGCAAIPALMAWLIRSPFACIVVCAGATYILMQASEDILRFHPVSRLGEAVTELSAETTLLCIGLIAAAVLAGWLILRFSDIR